MNKIISLPLLIIITIFISACNHANAEPQYDETIKINIQNNTGFEVYSLVLHCYQDGALRHTQGMINADGSKIKRGEFFTFEFLETDFNSQNEVLLEGVIKLTEDKVVKLKNHVPLKLEKNMIYNLGMK